MRLLEKLGIVKGSDSGLGTQIDIGSFRYGGYPKIAGQKAGVLRKIAGVGFVATGVITGNRSHSSYELVDWNRTSHTICS